MDGEHRRAGERTRSTARVGGRIGRMRPLRLFGVLSSLSMLSVGCFGPSLPRIDPERPFELAEDEGLLVIQVDTHSRLLRLVLSRAQVSEPVERGKHLFLVRARAGRYSWTGVQTPGPHGSRLRYTISGKSYLRPEELDFEVKAGFINYAGDLIIRETRKSYNEYWMNFRNRNHAAMAIRLLQQKYPALLERFPVRNASLSGDTFLDFYQSEKDRLAEPPEPNR